jgi:hypothetical protein
VNALCQLHELCSVDIEGESLESSIQSVIESGNKLLSTIELLINPVVVDNNDSDTDVHVDQELPEYFHSILQQHVTNVDLVDKTIRLFENKKNYEYQQSVIRKRDEDIAEWRNAMEKNPTKLFTQVYHEQYVKRFNEILEVASEETNCYRYSCVWPDNSGKVKDNLTTNILAWPYPYQEQKYDFWPIPISIATLKIHELIPYEYKLAEKLGLGEIQYKYKITGSNTPYLNYCPLVRFASEWNPENTGSCVMRPFIQWYANFPRVINYLETFNGHFTIDLLVDAYFVTKKIIKIGSFTTTGSYDPAITLRKYGYFCGMPKQTLAIDEAFSKEMTYDVKAELEPIMDVESIDSALNNYKKEFFDLLMRDLAYQQAVDQLHYSYLLMRKFFELKGTCSTFEMHLKNFVLYKPNPSSLLAIRGDFHRTINSISAECKTDPDSNYVKAVREALTKLHGLLMIEKEKPLSEPLSLVQRVYDELVSDETNPSIDVEELREIVQSQSEKIDQMSSRIDQLIDLMGKQKITKQ